MWAVLRSFNTDALKGARQRRQPPRPGHGERTRLAERAYSWRCFLLLGPPDQFPNSSTAAKHDLVPGSIPHSDFSNAGAAGVAMMLRPGNFQNALAPSKRE